MSRSLGPGLPSDLLDRLSGRDLESVASKVIQLFTIDQQGWPHPALLSFFEVVAADRQRIRLATYKTSTTSANMRRNGLATLVIIDTRNAVYIKGRVAEVATVMRSADWNAAFELRITDVLVDEVNEEYEPGAYVSSGVTYYNPGRLSDINRVRAILRELRDL